MLNTIGIVAVAALAANLPKKRARVIAAITGEAYRSRVRSLAKLSPLQIWHSKVELASEIDDIEHRALRRELRNVIAKARDHLAEDDNFPRLVTGKQVRIADRPPLIYHFTAKGDARHHVDAKRAFAAYESRLAPDRLCLVDRYALKDVAFKAVGVGSVGTFCVVGLFASGDSDPLFIQVKEAGKSVLECLGPKFSGHPGRRVVEGQRTMQAASDVFLGWTEDEASGRYFYARQLKNRRLGSVSEVVEQNALLDYARLCGRTLARAHAKTGGAPAIAGYLGNSASFDDAIVPYAASYADQVERDHAAFVAAARRGRIRTETAPTAVGELIR